MKLIAFVKLRVIQVMFACELVFVLQPLVSLVVVFTWCGEGIRIFHPVSIDGWSDLAAFFEPFLAQRTPSQSGLVG